jgi:hypothetical protein
MELFLENQSKMIHEFLIERKHQFCGIVVLSNECIHLSNDGFVHA